MLGFDLTQAVAAKQELRIAGAKEVHSLCPYCAVGCAIVAYTKQDAKGHTQLLQIEGDPDSLVNEGRLARRRDGDAAPAGRAAGQAALPRPGQRPWQEISWDQMLDGWPSGIKESRDATFVTQDAKGNTVNRCEGAAFAGGATFSSEEGYFAAKRCARLASCT